MCTLELKRKLSWFNQSINQSINEQAQRPAYWYLLPACNRTLRRGSRERSLCWPQAAKARTNVCDYSVDIRKHFQHSKQWFVILLFPTTRSHSPWSQRPESRTGKCYSVPPAVHGFKHMGTERSFLEDAGNSLRLL